MNEEIMFGVYCFLFLVFFMLVGIPVLMFLFAVYNKVTKKASKLTIKDKKEATNYLTNNQIEEQPDQDQQVEEEPDESLIYEDLFGE